MTDIGVAHLRTQHAARSTNAAPLTPDQAKARVYEKGMTLKEFAKKQGLNYRTVSEVIRGVNKGLFGEGHRAAVALGIKRG
jgi:gp16 family phage-associated protein